MTFRVVLDTNQVIAAGTGWIDHGRPSPDPNTSRRVLIKVAESHVGLYSGKIVGEYFEKLMDLNHPRERVVRLITYLMGAFERVTITTRSTPYPPSDANDEVFLLCALDGNADYLVSDDRALLNLKSKYGKPCIGKCFEIAVPLSA